MQRSESPPTIELTSTAKALVTLSSKPTADRWTKINTVSEALSSFVANAYWLGEFIDACFIEDEDPYFAELSFYALFIGISLAAIVTSGTLYAHYTLNVNYQDDNPSVLPEKPDDFLMEEELTPVSLSFWQTIALCLDAVTHTGDGASSWVFFNNLAFDSQTREQKILVQILATALGAAASKANVRTCKNSMLRNNRNRLSTIHSRRSAALTVPSIEADFWTKLTTSSDTVSSFLANSYWLGEGVDSCFPTNKPYFEKLSVYGFSFGLGLGGLASLGTLYAHFILNRNHQKHNGKTAVDPNYTPTLTYWQKAALALDAISHTGDSASSWVILSNLAMKSPSQEVKILVQCLATLIGAIGSRANVRTCKNSMLENNCNHHTIFAINRKPSISLATLYSSETNEEDSTSEYHLMEQSNRIPSP